MLFIFKATVLRLSNKSNQISTEVNTEMENHGACEFRVALDVANGMLDVSPFSASTSRCFRK